MNQKTKKLIILNLPYAIIGLFCSNIGEAWRIAEGTDISTKLLGFFTSMGTAWGNPMPSFHPFDLCIGLAIGAAFRLVVYVRSKNAKKYRHGEEYGSARWGGPKDIEPFADPVFENNVILTRTESLTMNSRPKDPKTARNKNVLIVGGSGSGKTRFWLKPNLLQCHSSYVITDPKGGIVEECGAVLVRNKYRIKIFNTINFKKSMHYNPFSYIHDEKDILKLAVHVIGKVMFLLIQGHILPVQLRLFGKLGKVLHCRAQTALFQPGKAQVLVKSSFHIHRSPFLLFAYINA